MSLSGGRPRTRVVVTGVGVVSAWGWGREPFWAGISGGGSAIGPFSRFDHAGHRTHVAGEVPPPPADLPVSVRDWPRLSWADRFAVAAAREALADAGLLDDGGPAPALAGAALFFASSTGGMLEGEEFYWRLRGAAPGRPALRLIATEPVSSPAEAVARAFGVAGPVETVSSACASGTIALGRTLDALRCGEVDLALAGGADSLCRTTYGGFNSLRSVDEEPCRPFLRERAGLSIGEGGAVLVVETVEHAAARGARALVELTGAGSTSDAGHMTAPHPEGEGAARALAAALADAGVGPGEVAFVNAHGTGTPLNDVAEGRALAAVLGNGGRPVPVTSTKGAVGHLLGSAGAVEAAATVLSLARGAVPPTAGRGEVDPETGVDLVRERPRAAGPGVAVSLNLAFGGCNAALVFAPAAGAPAAG